MNITGFKHSCNISLHYKGDCALLGSTATGNMYVEEYDDEGSIRHHLTADGAIIASGDLDVPELLHTPHSPAVHPLNHSGGRYRGLREYDRVAEWVQPLTVMEKMPLMQHLNLAISPMALLGIAESRVLSEAPLGNDQSIVCRRIRLAYALPQPQIDDAGFPYDYDTLVLHLAHTYEAESDTAPSLATVIQGLDGILLQHPVDCIVQEHRLIIADASDGMHVSRVMMYRVLSA
jgi:hypothetical protein